MIRIDNGRRYLFQWDLGQRLLIEDYPAGTSVHMAIEAQDRLAIPQSEGEKTGAVAFAVETYEEHGQSFADIPNILLQSAGLLHVYVYTSVGEEAHTDLSTHFSVVAREMPQCYEDDYDYSRHNSKLTALIAQIDQKLKNGELKGKDGANGKNGSNGTNGKDGKSAYETAKDGGYTGSESEFAAKLASETSGIHVGTDAPTDGSDVWIDTDEEAESGGSAQIDVTAEVGQTIIVEEVDDNGKPTKWKAVDYQPKTHWTEDVLLFDGVPEDEIDGNMVFVAAAPTIGNTYKITYNGTTYSCVGADSAIMGEAGSCVLGNVALAMGIGDTGEPFVLAYTEGMWFCTMFDGTTSPHISVTEVVYTPIPQQYLGNAFPYYIEITGSGTTDDPYVCAETVQNVMTVYNSGREIKARLKSTLNSNGGYTISELPLIFLIWNDSALALFFTSQGYSTGEIIRIILVPNEDGTYTVTTSLD